MKKLLIVLSLMFFTIDSSASGIASNTTSAPCTNNTLETYSGNSNLSADWQPNTINLTWYNEQEKLTVQQSAQSCVYDGTLTIPSTPPTRTGYTFAGWKVRLPGTYTELEYLESTGTQFVDTNFSSPNGFKAQLGLYFDTVGYSFLMGSHNNSMPWGRNYLKLDHNNYSGTLLYYSVGAGDFWVGTNVVRPNTKYDIEFSTVKNNTFFTGDTLEYLGGTGEDTRSINSIYLFDMHGWNYSSGEVYLSS